MKDHSNNPPSVVTSLEKHLKKKKIRKEMASNRAKLEEIADLGARLVNAVGEACEEALERREAEIDSK